MGRMSPGGEDRTSSILPCIWNQCIVSDGRAHRFRVHREVPMPEIVDVLDDEYEVATDAPCTERHATPPRRTVCDDSAPAPSTIIPPSSASEPGDAGLAPALPASPAHELVPAVLPLADAVELSTGPFC